MIRIHHISVVKSSYNELLIFVDYGGPCGQKRYEEPFRFQNCGTVHLLSVVLLIQCNDFQVQKKKKKKRIKKHHK